MLFEESQVLPHAVQFVVVLRGDSQPLALLPEESQSPKPATQPVYTHLPPTHAAPVLVAVSHFTPHAPQLSTVFVGDSHPSVSGGVVLQSPKPAAQPLYVHVVPPLHAAPRLCVVSHVLPQPPHPVAPVVDVSQPSRSGAVVLQSAKPGLQLV